MLQQVFVIIFVQHTNFISDQSDAQESPDPQDAQEKHKSPPCPKKKSKKKVKVVHSKEYKIRQPKKASF